MDCGALGFRAPVARGGDPGSLRLHRPGRLRDLGPGGGSAPGLGKPGHLSICLSISLYLSIYLSIYLYIYISVYRNVNTHYMYMHVSNRKGMLTETCACFRVLSTARNMVNFKTTLSFEVEVVS